MPFTVTAIRNAPERGSLAISRFSPDGVMEVASQLLAEGLLEIEIRDHRGNLLGLRDIERSAGRSSDPALA